MGKEKGGFLTPKAIANRIKSKGLQKLRWYCQMCQKQCRDENGFKCHTMSESHQRQLLLFAESPDKYIDSFSEDFFTDYVELLKRRFGKKRVNCNIVYQEYIAFKEHTHMNSTQWETLTEFVKWLGREGHCVVDETEKGWFVQYIDRDPEAIKKQEQIKAKEKMELDDEERAAKFIRDQIERASAQGQEVKQTEFTELKRENEEEKVTLSLGGLSKKKETDTVASSSKDNPLKKPPISSLENPFKKPSGSGVIRIKTEKAGQKRKSALEEIMELEKMKKENVNKKVKKDYWLHEGIMVKIVTKKLGEKYYKKKAVVKEVVDLYRAVIKLIDSGDKMKVDQSHLETVIPAQGKKVLIVNGAYRGESAILETIDEKKFSCSVSIATGPSRGRVIEGIEYEDLSKLYQP
ncbi:DNA/RNA-binding protein KIN17-like [Mytilus trossulus]|uniref:DNA/RNA-binding protein KIN17-like n=1 Tax=Mytilus trossulus TaxID=6551 RepID=UPI00300758FA